MSKELKKNLVGLDMKGRPIKDPTLVSAKISDSEDSTVQVELSVRSKKAKDQSSLVIKTEVGEESYELHIDDKKSAFNKDYATVDAETLEVTGSTDTVAKADDPRLLAVKDLLNKSNTSGGGFDSSLLKVKSISQYDYISDGIEISTDSGHSMVIGSPDDENVVILGSYEKGNGVKSDETRPCYLNGLICGQIESLFLDPNYSTFHIPEVAPRPTEVQLIGTGGVYVGPEELKKFLEYDDITKNLLVGGFQKLTSIGEVAAMYLIDPKFRLEQGSKYYLTIVGTHSSGTGWELYTGDQSTRLGGSSIIKNTSVIEFTWNNDSEESLPQYLVIKPVDGDSSTESKIEIASLTKGHSVVIPSRLGEYIQARYAAQTDPNLLVADQIMTYNTMGHCQYYHDGVTGSLVVEFNKGFDDSIQTLDISILSYLSLPDQDPTMMKSSVDVRFSGTLNSSTKTITDYMIDIRGSHFLTQARVDKTKEGNPCLIIGNPQVNSWRDTIVRVSQLTKQSLNQFSIDSLNINLIGTTEYIDQFGAEKIYGPWLMVNKSMVSRSNLITSASTDGKVSTLNFIENTFIRDQYYALTFSCTPTSTPINVTLAAGEDSTSFDVIPDSYGLCTIVFKYSFETSYTKIKLTVNKGTDSLKNICIVRGTVGVDYIDPVPVEAASAGLSVDSKDAIPFTKNTAVNELNIESDKSLIINNHGAPEDSYIIFGDYDKLATITEDPDRHNFTEEEIKGLSNVAARTVFIPETESTTLFKESNERYSLLGTNGVKVTPDTLMDDLDRYYNQYKPSKGFLTYNKDSINIGCLGYAYTDVGFVPDLSLSSYSFYKDPDKSKLAHIKCGGVKLPEGNGLNVLLDNGTTAPLPSGTKISGTTNLLMYPGRRVIGESVSIMGTSGIRGKEFTLVTIGKDFTFDEFDIVEQVKIINSYSNDIYSTKLRSEDLNDPKPSVSKDKLVVPIALYSGHRDNVDDPTKEILTEIIDYLEWNIYNKLSGSWINSQGHSYLKFIIPNYYTDIQDEIRSINICDQIKLQWKSSLNKITSYGEITEGIIAKVSGFELTVVVPISNITLRNSAVVVDEEVDRVTYVFPPRISYLSYIEGLDSMPELEGTDVTVEYRFNEGPKSIGSDSLVRGDYLTDAKSDHITKVRDLTPKSLDLTSLTPKVFRYNTDDEGTERIGLDPSDLKAICPELVNENDQIDYGKFSLLLLECIKDLSKKVNSKGDQ